jgi:methyl-accepting chemotaxis protein
MNALKNLRIGARLGLGFGLVLLLLAASALTALARMARMHDHMREIAFHNAQQNLSVKMRISVNQVVIASRNALIATDAAAVQEWSQTMQRSLANYDAARKELGAHFESQAATPEERNALAGIDQHREAALPPTERTMALLNQGDHDGASKLTLAEAQPAQRGWLNATGELAQVEDKLNEHAQQAADADYDSAKLLVLVLSACAFGCGAVAAWLITRSIVTPIQDAVNIARTVASGDLTSSIQVDRRDEAGELLSALKDMNDSLVRVVSQVLEGSDHIATGAKQIATGNQDLSQRTEEQASNLQQTASSMEQLSSTVKHNAESASQATQLASGARDVALQGGEVVGRVVSTMKDISDASRKINEIIGVIDGIAFQTNILALNAAVEAARAGEQGRGFAVVASEVRSLAQRSAAAAKEIKSLIGDSVEKVDAGARLVDDAGRTMDAIVAQVKHVADLIGEIGAATLEQTGGIEQVSTAVGQLDQVTQQNAALVEESASAADSLSQQASRLVEAVAVFKLAASRHTF